MPTLLLVAGLALLPIGTPEPVHDLRVVDLDADGNEDVVAVGARTLFLLRGGRGPVITREAAPLTVVGRGLLGVVREGRYRPVRDPFGAWEEGEPGPRCLVGARGAGAAALLASPGDLDGDGRDDAILPGEDGFATPAGLVPLRPEARLEIGRNECFAVEWRVPVPAVGNWTGEGRELVFFSARELSVWRGERCVERVETRLGLDQAGVDRVGRQHVAARDVDGNGRLDLLVVSAKGSAGFFGSFDAVVYLFPDGRFHDARTGKFRRPKSVLKVEGALLESTLLDADSDGDLDLALATVDTSIVATATGHAPGSFLVFRLDADGYSRSPAWSHEAAVPLAAFRAHPEPPLVFLPDLDDDGHPEALELRPDALALLEADGAGAFSARTVDGVRPTGRPALGAGLVALPTADGLLVIRGSGS